MNKKETPEKPPQAAAAAAEQDNVDRIVGWVRRNERIMGVVLAVVALGAAAVWFAVSAKSRREAFAARELATARQAADAGNLPLAASDLSRIVGTLGGTRAGQEAQLVLAEVRLRQGQAALAATELEAFVASGPAQIFRPQAYELLGVALEQTGQMKSAGDAYEKGAAAATAADYGYLSATLLLDAGRSYAAGADTASAIRVLERVVKEHETTNAASEAKLRLAELGRYNSST